MNVWDSYAIRTQAMGKTRREIAYNKEVQRLNRLLPASLSYHIAIVDGLERNVAIINSDNLNEKLMYSMPKEDFDCGGLVEWMDNHWLITEKDANNEIYTKVKLLQCNHILRWIDENDVIKEQWCVVEDGTKYLTGEMEDRFFFTTRGDSRIAIHIGRNEDTVKLGRQNRFLVDDPDHEHKLAYALTKPLRFGHTYNNKGIYSFVCQEVVATDDDNQELGIADYYKHFPREQEVEEIAPTVEDKYEQKPERKVWL